MEQNAHKAAALLDDVAERGAEAALQVVGLIAHGAAGDGEDSAIMKMVGATNGFIRWPFVYEGFIIGLLSAGVAFGLQWLLYATVARSISVSDALNLFSVVDFATIWKPVALVFVGVGMLVGVGGSLTAIRKFLQV